MNLIGVLAKVVDNKRVMSPKGEKEKFKMQGILQNTKDEADGVL